MQVVLIMFVVLLIKGGALGIIWEDSSKQSRCILGCGLFSVLEAEAMALKEAIQHAISPHFSHVTFESDCQLVVIKSIQNLLYFFSNFEVIKSIQNLLYFFLKF